MDRVVQGSVDSLGSIDGGFVLMTHGVVLVDGNVYCLCVNLSDALP